MLCFGRSKPRLRQGSVPDDSLGWLAPFCVLVCLSVLWTVLPRRSELTLERDLFLIVFLHLHRSLSFFRSFILVYKKNTIQMAKVEEYRRHNLDIRDSISVALLPAVMCNNVQSIRILSWDVCDTSVTFKWS